MEKKYLWSVVWLFPELNKWFPYNDFYNVYNIFYSYD